MGAQILLFNGEIALVDDQDMDDVSRFKWRACPKGTNVYARSYCRRPDGHKTTQSMHKLITGWTFVDHINGNGLDNRRANLRQANSHSNGGNRRKVCDSSSIYKGVTWHANANRWQTVIGVKGRKKYLGLFTNEIDAAIAYDTAAREVFGEYAALNFPLPGEQSAITAGGFR